MAIGERINFFRRRCNLTMNALGQLLGFDEKGADVRIAQYENNSRKPKAELTQSMADVFGVVPEALTVPDIVHLDKFVTQPGTNLWQYLDDWYSMKEKYIHGRITKEEYDHWRYNFPNDGTSVLTAKVPPESSL